MSDFSITLDPDLFNRLREVLDSQYTFIEQEMSEILLANEIIEAKTYFAGIREMYGMQAILTLWGDDE